MAGETVLVIDDSPTILKVVQLVLTKAGFYVITASDGDEGIEEAKRQPPDVILLDFVMPKMNGYQVCQSLHQEDNLKEIPIILMSAKGDQVGDRFIEVMGIVDYITKPFSPEAITAVVQHTVAKFKNPDSAREESAGAMVPKVTPEEAAAAASAAVEARRSALIRFQEGMCRQAAQAVVAGAKEQGTTLNEAETVTWLVQKLSLPTLELQLGELRTTAPELTGDNDAALAGDLKIVPLAEVLLLLSQQEQSGVLGITRDHGLLELHFHEGKVMLGTATGVPEEFLLGRFILQEKLMTRESLELFLKDHAGTSSLMGSALVKAALISLEDLKKVIRQQTCELVYELLRWAEGKFAFRATADQSALAAEAALGLNVDSILMEGFRRVDEWHLIEREIDNFATVYLRNEDAVTRMGRSRLTREELAILELVNGKNTVKEIIRQSRMGSFDVSKMLYRLLSIKLIRERVPPVAV
jgi:DNA-binding response OmpR family regulator